VKPPMHPLIFKNRQRCLLAGKSSFWQILLQQTLFSGLHVF